MEKYWMWIALAVVAVWFFFLRKARVSGGANLGIVTGNNATPYPGYAPGQYPPGVSPTGYNGAAPAPPRPIYLQGGGTAQGDTTGGILAGVGGLIGGIGSGLGSVFSGLGQSGLLTSGGGGGGAYPADGDWTGDW